MDYLRSCLYRLIATRSHDGSRSGIGASGAVALITAICAPVLVVIIGFACDYGYASYINQRLARATDSATIGSVSQTAATTAGGYDKTDAMQAIGVNLFKANASDLPLTGVSFTLSVTADGTGGVVATGSYSYPVPTFFGGLLGVTNIPVSGTAKTSARPVVYVNYYILVDTSQSMGIAATQADMDALYNRVAAYGNASTSDPGCVFGCHVKQKIGTNPDRYQPYTNEDLAHNVTANRGPKINLRIDAAVSAIQSIISTAASVAATTKNIQFALYTIQLDPTTNNKISQVASLSNNYSSLNAAAGTIELGNNTGDGIGDSDFYREISAFNTILTQNGVTANGSGASATSPLNFVFIVTDGLSDVLGNCNGHSHCDAAFDPNYCSSLKSKSTVGTIYTTYAPIYRANNKNNGYDGNFIALVQPYTMPTDSIASGLKSCASSSDYAFQATDGPDIVSAMQSLFQRTQPSSARIIQ